MNTPYNDVGTPYGEDDTIEPYNSTRLPYFIGGDIPFTLDNTILINGFTITPLGLDYTYSDSGRVNDAGTILYLAKGDYTGEEELLISQGTSATTGTISFTNQDPSPNPDEDAGAVVLNTSELANQVFSAMLVNPLTRKYGVLTTTSATFSVGSAYLSAGITYIGTLAETNRAQFRLIVDTTLNSGWATLQSGIFEVDYLSTSPIAYIGGDNIYGVFTTRNTNAGGQTAPFDRRYSFVIQDTITPYYYGNFAIIQFEILLSQSVNSTDLLGNPTLSLTSPASLQFWNAPPTLENVALTWNGISSIALFEDRIEITKSGSWTSDWYYKINGGTTQIVSGGATSVSVSLTNGDSVEVIQPFTGSTITQTFTKFISASYVSNPPTSYNLEVQIAGVNLPALVSITQGATTLHQYTQTTLTQDIGDLRALGIYGVGVITLSVDTINTTFDASYYNDGTNTYSGSEIIGYAPSVSESSGTLTWTFNGTYQYKTANEELYFGDYANQSALISGATPDATSFTSTITDSDFVSPTDYGSDTPIPAINKTLLAVLSDLSIQSPLYSQLTSYNVSDTYFKGEFGSFYFLDSTTNLLTCRIDIQTAFGIEWRLLGSVVLRLEYDDTIIQPSSVSSIVFQDSGDVFGDPSGIQRYRLEPVSTARAGSFELVNVIFEVYDSSDISTALSLARYTSIQDETATEYLALKNLDITNASFFWTGITDFSFNASSITITRSGSTSASVPDWAYQITPISTSIPGTKTFVNWTQTSVSGLTLFNGDIVEVFQPINGTDITKTISGITFSFTFTNPSFTTGDNTTLPSTRDNPLGLCLHPNGTSFAVHSDQGTALSSHYISIYSMFPPFDITTAPATPSVELQPSATNGKNLFIDETTGFVYYIRGISGTDRITQEVPTSVQSYNNWATLSLSGVNNQISLPQGATNIGTASGLALYSSTGGSLDRMVISATNGVINFYSFTASPFSVSLISQYITGLNIGGLDAKPDGSKLYAVRPTGDIVEYDISQPGDILNTTPVNTQSLSTIITTGGGTPPASPNFEGISIDRATGNYLFVVNQLNTSSEVFKINL